MCAVYFILLLSLLVRQLLKVQVLFLNFLQTRWKFSRHVFLVYILCYLKRALRRLQEHSDASYPKNRSSIQTFTKKLLKKENLLRLNSTLFAWILFSEKREKVEYCYANTKKTEQDDNISVLLIIIIIVMYKICSTWWPCF